MGVTTVSFIRKLQAEEQHEVWDQIKPVMNVLDYFCSLQTWVTSEVPPSSKQKSNNDLFMALEKWDLGEIVPKSLSWQRPPPLEKVLTEPCAGETVPAPESDNFLSHLPGHWSHWRYEEKWHNTGETAISASGTNLEVLRSCWKTGGHSIYLLIASLLKTMSPSKSPSEEVKPENLKARKETTRKTLDGSEIHIHS